MCVGKIGVIDDDIVIVGGNCSIQGFDSRGDDVYWTVCMYVCMCVCMYIYILEIIPSIITIQIFNEYFN